jgi:ankyrin repeat protein/tetratricopeptide (TPR) repeat protein
MKHGRDKTVVVITILLGAGLFVLARTNSASAMGYLVERVTEYLSDTDEHPLHKAARRGQTKQIRRLLDKGADPDVKDEEGRTPLYAAAAFGKLQAVKLLVEHGADVETRTKDNFSPLFVAAIAGHCDVIKQLIEAGAEVDGENIYGRTALFVAVEKERKKAVRILLERGANVNSRCSHFPRTPLHMAAALGRVDIATILLANGANVNDRDITCGVTALHIAEVAGERRMSAVLSANGADDTIQDNYGQTPAKLAAMMKERLKHELVPASEIPGPFDERALVQLVHLATTRDAFNYKGLRMGFAVGDGSLVVTAAHCVGDIIEDSAKGCLVRPKVISRYYGDIFDAEILGVDKEADVAILRPAWDAHPALELADTESLTAARELLVASHLPLNKNHSKRDLCRDVYTEKSPIVRVDLEDGNDGIVAGGTRCVEKGWSGSPMVQARTARVVGVLSGGRDITFAGKVFLKYHVGGSVKSIHSLLTKEGIELSNRTDAAELIEIADAEKAFSTLTDCFWSFTNEDVPGALSEAKKLILLRPRSVNLHSLLAALAEANKGTDPQAVELAESSHVQALELASESAEAHAGYANFLGRNKRTDEALVELKKAVELEPDNTFVLFKLVGILKGEDANEAQVFARRLVDNHPDNAEYWYELSGVLSKAGDRDTAVAAARKAVSLSDHVPHLHRRRLADALRDTADYGGAEDCYKLLLNEHECARCWFAYAQLLSRLGAERCEQTIEALNKVESMNQDELVKPESINELREKVRETELQGDGEQK